MDQDHRAPHRAVKVGVHEGGGPPPGYLWSVAILDQAFGEARCLLDDDQYAHLARQVKELACNQDPTHSATVDVRSIESFYELREKGGILKRLNMRVFFFVDKPRRTIVILGTINKKNDGQTPDGDRIRMRRRMRLYLESLR